MMKSIYSKTVSFFSVATLIFSSLTMAESIQKHPRVAELEDSLQQKASTYLKARFPEQPFLVSVNIEPLRRQVGKAAESSESLPYFDSNSEEIQDEWDDPNLSLQQLQLRTSKILIDVSLSDIVSDNESSEVKESLIRSLHLTPVRDEVRVESRNWKSSSSSQLQTILVFGAISLFLIGLYFINRQSTSKLTRVISESSKNAPASMPMGISAGSSSQQDSPDHRDSGPRKGVQLSDPLKVRELLAKTADALEQKPGFPSLQAMVELDRYGMKHPAQLGAILNELKSETRARLFSLSFGDWWLEAMTKPAHFEIEHLEFMQKLQKEPASNKSAAMNDMLVKVWRLNEKLPEFMRSMNREEAFAILSQLPKGKAIDAARKAFPGAWADLLDPAYSAKKLTDQECSSIAEKAASQVPLRHPLSFDKHKMEMDLREFLLEASVEEEREIYTASKSDSAIHAHRPPFYKVLESDPEILKQFVGRFSPEQWACALFNVAQTERKKVQAHFSEKQLFMFAENLKRQDRSGDHSPVGKTREFIGAEFKNYQIHLEAQAIQAMNEAETSNEANPDEEKIA